MNAVVWISDHRDSSPCKCNPLGMPNVHAGPIRKNKVEWTKRRSVDRVLKRFSSHLALPTFERITLLTADRVKCNRLISLTHDRLS
jgi:hypothetical protein